MKRLPTLITALAVAGGALAAMPALASAQLCSAPVVQITATSRPVPIICSRSSTPASARLASAVLAAPSALAADPVATTARRCPMALHVWRDFSGIGGLVGASGITCKKAYMQFQRSRKRPRRYRRPDRWVISIPGWSCRYAGRWKQMRYSFLTRCTRSTKRITVAVSW